MTTTTVLIVFFVLSIQRYGTLSTWLALTAPLSVEFPTPENAQVPSNAVPSLLILAITA